MTRLVLGCAVVALFLAGAGCGGSPGFAGKRLGSSSRLVDFALHDQDGRVVSFSSYRGRYVVVSFLYTRCTDVCPLIASNIGEALRQLGAARRLAALAVSVDPVGDTSVAVSRFLHEHRAPRSFRFLSGSRAELQPVWQEFNVLVESRNEIRISHDAPVFVVDPHGRPVLLYSDHVTSRQLVRDLRRLLG